MPLLNNYGGLLQNYALQKVLQKFGHQVKTVDFVVNPSLSFFQLIIAWIKCLLLYLIPSKRRRFARIKNVGKRRDFSKKFCDSFIIKTPTITKYSKNLLKRETVSTIIVGSDQVWRPKYNYRIEDMFLKFAEKMSIKRIAYAASFGVDNWEYTPKQTVECAGLARKFKAISVREESGVMLSKEHLGVDATWVLDPTLLLKKEDYCDVCKDVPVAKEKFLAAYVLDKNNEIRALCESIAAKQSLTLKFFEANSKATLTVPEWLAVFRDASYVVTDSFHGTVFSIIFGKEFKCLYNESRGSTRFDSLLKLYESGKLDEMREFSLNWLKNALEK